MYSVTKIACNCDTETSYTTCSFLKIYIIQEETVISLSLLLHNLILHLIHFLPESLYISFEVTISHGTLQAEININYPN